MIITYMRDEDSEGKTLMIMNSNTERGGFKG